MENARLHKLIDDEMNRIVAIAVRRAVKEFAESVFTGAGTIADKFLSANGVNGLAEGRRVMAPPTCSECGTVGHNMRGCPITKEKKNGKAKK